MMRRNNISKKMEEELNKLDDLYIHAYETKSINMLKSVAKPEFLYRLSRLAVTHPRYFSDKQYRENDWELLSQDGSTYMLSKTCVYQTCRLGPIRKVKIANDYSEVWSVCYIDARLCIIDIQEEVES